MSEQVITPMTNEQATDEAVLLFIRKIRKLHPEAFRTVWAKLPEGAQETLRESEQRADHFRNQGELAGVAIGTRPWPNYWAAEDED